MMVRELQYIHVRTLVVIIQSSSLFQCPHETE